MGVAASLVPCAVAGPVAVVIAHPDDESMFFAPSVAHLVQNGERVLILCLSTGNFYGLGETRKRELGKACAVLGVRQEDVSIVEHPQLQDGSQERWPAQVVAKFLADFVEKHSIQTILTFDALGVSGHSDHADVHRGVEHFLRAFGGDRDLTAFELTSTGLLRKYSGLLDLPMSLSLARRPPLEAFFVSFSFGRAWRAMAAHRSQFVWYRRLFVIFSRYAYINTFKRMSPRR